MSFPIGVPRGKPWDAPWQPAVRHSVEVMFGGRLLESWERGETSNDKALDAVVEHVRAKVEQGVREPGRYRFILVGTSDYREVRLSGPGRGS